MSLKQTAVWLLLDERPFHGPFRAILVAYFSCLMARLSTPLPGSLADGGGLLATASNRNSSSL